MITREFNLYLHAGHSIPLVINANQYDHGEQWLFTLFNSDGTQYVPSSGAIVGIKSDNLGIINSGSVDSQGRVVINETQQMTAAVGKAVFELLIDDQTHGTANFIVLVEPKPGDNADLSESDLSLIQQAIDGTSATAIAQGVSDWMDENLTPTTPVVDASLTVSGAAADSAKVGQELSDLKSQIEQSGTDSYVYVEGTTLYMGDNMTGSINITQNGSYNVKKYATANVNVPTSGGGGITPTGTKQITITENSTITVDVSAFANAEITVNVPTSGGETASSNLVDPSELSVGYYIAKSSGDVTQMPTSSQFYNDWKLSDYIPVNASNISSVNCIGDTSQSSYSYNVYDENKTKLRSIAGQRYTYQSGDYYVRICFNTNGWVEPIICMANYGNTALPAEEYVGGN